MSKVYLVGNVIECRDWLINEYVCLKVKICTYPFYAYVQWKTQGSASFSAFGAGPLDQSQDILMK